jgi:catechol 2,3-dioxygenase
MEVKMNEKAGFKVGQLDHVEMFVPGRYETARWYERTLGLSVVAEYEHWADDPNGPLMISSDGGSTKLALFRGRPPGEKRTAGFHRVAFRVQADSFLLFLRMLEQTELYDHRNRRLTKEMVADHGRSYSIYFSDPYGHRLEITSYDYETVASSLLIEK